MFNDRFVEGREQQGQLHDSQVAERAKAQVAELEAFIAESKEHLAHVDGVIKSGSYHPDCEMTTKSYSVPSARAPLGTPDVIY